MRTCPWILGSVLISLLFSTGCVSDESLKQVENEISDLKIEVFKLRRQAEEVNKKLDEERIISIDERHRTKRFQADMHEVMSQVYSNTRNISNQLGDTKSQISTKPIVEQLSVADNSDFTTAMLDFHKGNYAIAADGLSLYIKTNPKSRQCSEAIFYLGLCLYHQALYDKAKEKFDQIIREYADSNQFVLAKLKRGQCFCKMNMKPAAIKAFKEIVDNFSGSSEADIARQELAELGF